jgi:VWFA-related protein
MVATPVSVALDLDYSSSITPVQNAVEEAAKSFLDKLNAATDEAAVIKFASVVELAKDFTPLTPADKLQALKDAIDAPYPDSTPGTRLYDAVDDSVDRLALRANDRLASVVLSDGNDDLSDFDLDDVITNAQNKKIFIFTIGLVGETGVNAEVLQLMAVKTGGLYFEAPNAGALDGIYAQISQVLTNQYEITFDTTRPVGTTNTLQVVVTQGALDGEDTESVVY